MSSRFLSNFNLASSSLPSGALSRNYSFSSPLCWSSPPSGYVKLNIDGSRCSRTGLTCCGKAGHRSTNKVADLLARIGCVEERNVTFYDTAPDRLLPLQHVGYT
ncbi:hypothetical protein V6N11_034187 [Hibiscus sabdariffa]|uniref:Uncharacterized protein n=1 Tax=Hibiscus sabdariffa TaxID=183260 RepID=A0ABR2S292_9ROSI